MFASAEDRPVSYSRDIRPLLASRCFACHGPDDTQRKADLRLDTPEAVGAMGVIKPGKANDSELITRLTTTDEETRMPPAASKKPGFTAEETALIRRWVDQGAKYDAHWAFVKPNMPKVPAGANFADYFLEQELKRQGLTFAAEADKRTLLRRLSFDLRGLPPTADEVAAFEADASPGAYEKVVDALLASPHYGERMAAYWLDIVRYADTGGYHSDNPRNVAPYRDYVIQAFNANTPFDRFAREQLAGDLLPNATLTQKVASGYNRLLQTTEEGGAQAKEYTAKYAADRVRNFGSAWLALTTGCCECHNHKFDPLSIKDFYSLAAFFADIQEAAVGRREPGIPVPTAEQSQKLAELQGQIAAAEKALNDAAEREAASLSQIAATAEWLPVKILSQRVEGSEAKLESQADGSLKSVGKVGSQEAYEIILSAEAADIRGLRLEALTDSSFPANGPGTAPNGNFVLTEFRVDKLAKDDKERQLKIAKVVADHSQQQFPVDSTLKKNPGWAVLPQIGRPHEAVYQLAEKITLGDGERLKVTLAFGSPHAQHSIGRLRLTVTSAEKPAESYIGTELRALAAKPAAERTADDKQKLTQYVRERNPAVQPQRDELAKAQAAYKQLDESVPKSLISVSGTPRTVRILARGNWLDDSGEEVKPAVPVSLKIGEAPAEKRLGRVELADWLVNRENPLTARVFVNRLWKIAFGRGLVRTMDDFGLQGSLPSHPELLDALAVDFMDHGWDVKRTLKQLVMSRAYRQSSTATKELVDKDPTNEWFARQNRFRVDAEMVRDNALFVSGLLVPTIGGDSVKPYQPSGYWQYLNFPTREWQHDRGPNLYRRGLYTFWQRSFLHPSLMAFDAPSREECVVERTRSNTPQQALVLLNDPTYVEAARSLAVLALQQGGGDFNARLEFVFRRTLQRSPRPEELKVLLPLYERHKQQFLAESAAADKLLQVGESKTTAADKSELAAWTGVCRVVLNLHETTARN